MGGDARRTAFDILRQLDRDRGATVAGLMERHARLPERERALARELALGAVRHRRLYDHLADRFLARRDAQPAALRHALRLACHQLFALDRVPPHAATDTTVTLLRSVGEARLAGVANAVLRRLAALRTPERDPSSPGPLGRLRPADRPREIGLRYSLPDALVRDLRPAAPDPDEDATWAALDLVPPLCTRTRPGRTLADDPAILRREGPWTWWSRPEPALRGPVAAGDAVVQDRTQGALIELADPRPGERVCDLCAAPGGKTRYLCDRGCRVVAADVAPAKAAALRDAVGDAAAVLVQDGRRPALAAAFDLVVVDAPCSNSGVIARRPEARWRYGDESLAGLAALQDDLLRAAAGLARPGGRLLYTTCSLAARENRERTAALHGWRIADERTVWPDGWGGGGYAALLVRSKG